MGLSGPFRPPALTVPLVSSSPLVRNDRKTMNQTSFGPSHTSSQESPGDDRRRDEHYVRQDGSLSRNVPPEFTAQEEGCERTPCLSCLSPGQSADNEEVDAEQNVIERAIGEVKKSVSLGALGMESR